MQTGIQIGADSISGSLKYVTGYTGFSSKKEEQSGNYLALKFDIEPSDAITTVEILNGTSGPVTLDEDKMFVGLITKPEEQKIKVVATAGDVTSTKIYDLNGLTLESKPQQ